ncbi:hypothetical protein ACMATS_37880 (plasmid) [Streptoverticillium reticulum]|uniref:hypothetical protein n=1 Tax=Streptoverticillium reticulum TaxID=1433415 RepID=UPI0039BF15DC
MTTTPIPRTAKTAAAWLAEADDLYARARDILFVAGDTKLLLHRQSAEAAGALAQLAGYARSRSLDLTTAECHICEGTGQIGTSTGVAPCYNRAAHR